MGEFTTLMARDGHEFNAWLAPAQGGARGAVVLCQEIFGVNHHIRGVADSFASAGYLTIAPTGRLSFALRGETLQDNGGTRFGTDSRTTLSEGTFTPAFKFTDHVVLRGEVRYDRASQPILAKGDSFSDRQTTAGVNFIIVY